MKGLLHVNYHDKGITFILKRSFYHAPLNNNLINPACGTFQYKTRCQATAFHSSLVEQNHLVRFHKQSESCEGEPSSKLVLFSQNQTENG